jgi:cell shape-determining protein MreD
LSVLRFFAALAVAVLFHLLGVRLVSEFSLVFDVFVVLVVLYGLQTSSFTALFIGMLVGLTHDSLAGGGNFGLFGFADTIIGYGAARLAQRLVIQRATGVLALVSFATVAQQAIVIGLMFLMLPSPELPNPAWVAIKAGACGLLGMFIYVASAHWRRASEARRRGRMSRLRLN